MILSVIVSIINTVDTAHEDVIHDAQMDFYGTKLATCSSDRTLKIFNVSLGQQTHISTLIGHEGPVWQVAWSHPTYDSLLASCGYDKRVIIWKETNGVWSKLHECTKHNSSVNSICWAPPEFGLMLCCGSSDGSITILSSKDAGRWDVDKIQLAHSIGCNAVSWGPAVSPGALMSTSDAPVICEKKFVSGGCDNLIKIWREDDGHWVEDTKLEGHKDWVRDVAWAPIIGQLKSIIASCSQDRQVIIWSTDSASTNHWQPQILHRFNDVVWHVSWSITGGILAVSGGDNKVSIWKETLDAKWTCISEIDKQMKE